MQNYNGIQITENRTKLFDENYHKVYLSPEQVCWSNPANMVLILLTAFVPVHFNHLFL